MNRPNDKQLEAITCGNEPVIVIAGAGSGKTYVLVERIIYLINEMNINHNKILAFTFTNKAANEMKQRIIRKIPNINFRWVGTFHSVCLMILSEDIEVLNKSKNFVVIDDDDQKSIIKKIYTENNYDNNLITQKTMHKYLCDIKKKDKSYLDDQNNNDFNLNEMIDDILDKYDLSEKKIEFIKKVYSHYQSYLQKHNNLDFDDLIFYVIKLLLTSEKTRQKWQNRFDYILVDEFQDTNKQQFELIKLLKKDRQNIFVVGDPDQMIYSWRGSYDDIFKDFEKYFNQNCKQIILEQNYRSTNQILTTSNILISNNKNRVQKDLYTKNQDGQNIKYYRAIDSLNEIKWVTNNIIDLISSPNNYSYNDILILYRSNYLSRNIEQGLIAKSIPYVIYGGLKFYQRKEIKDILAYLKIIAFDDDNSLNRVYNVPKRKISEKTFIELIRYANLNNLLLITVIENIDKYDLGLKTTAINSVKKFYELIVELKKFKYQSVTDLIDKIIELTKYKDYLVELSEQYRLDNIEELKNAIKEYELTNHTTSLEKYLQDVSIYTDIDEKTDQLQNDEKVRLMTIHQAKGLEFKNVFIIELNDGDFPSSKSVNDGAIDEERRILYVAMTRAQCNLFLSSNASKKYINGSFDPKEESRYIKELQKSQYFEVIKPTYQVNVNHKDDWFNSRDNNKYQNTIQKELNIEFGDYVVHEIFGEGVCVGIKDKSYDIMFTSPYGLKEIQKNHYTIKAVKKYGSK